MEDRNLATELNNASSIILQTSHRSMVYTLNFFNMKHELSLPLTHSHFINAKPIRMCEDKAGDQ